LEALELRNAPPQRDWVEGLNALGNSSCPIPNPPIPGIKKKKRGLIRTFPPNLQMVNGSLWFFHRFNWN